MALEALLPNLGPQDEARRASLSAMFYFEKERSRTGVGRWLLWGEYRDQHPDGFSNSRFCNHFKHR